MTEARRRNKFDIYFSSACFGPGLTPHICAVCEKPLLKKRFHFCLTIRGGRICLGFKYSDNGKDNTFVAVENEIRIGVELCSSCVRKFADRSDRVIESSMTTSK